jgi:hypothetical protein
MRGKETQLRLRTFRTLAAAMVFSLAAGAVSAQTLPTATISGKAVDQQGLAVPGATVTAQSPVLQGSRTAVTSQNGDYILPFLPAGQYTLTFELTGFATVKRTQRVTPGETVTLNPTMGVSTMEETVTVIGESTVVGQGAEVATSIKQDLVDKLPMARTFLAAALMVPGVQDSGPNGGFSINGSMSFESLYLVNGVVVNENIRGQALGLFIEDALQETTVSTAAISAEFGRFQGGVLQAITKSGGNSFSGSYRATFDNNKWVSLTPFTNDRRTDKIFLQHEVTLGGPVLKDKVWFFGAGRLTTPKQTTTNTTTATNLNWDNVRDQKRFEGKLTWALNANHSFKGAYTKIQDKEDGNAFTPIMDRASLVNRETPQDLLSANYTGIITPKFFVEGQYSRRRFTFVGSGSQFTDLIKGTLMLDQSRANARFNSPTFCGVCTDEGRDNQNVVLKATYYASTGSWGSHNIVGGLDMFDDKRLANNHQSGSDYRVFVTSTILQGENIFPVLDSRTFIRWTPIFTESEGNRFRTLSGFVNDQWNFNTKWTFNLGLRFDKNDGKNSQGEVVVKDSALSPRLSATFDPKGDGAWGINAAYAQYVAAIANGVGDASSAGGVPATIDFDYLGPTVNLGSPANPVSSAQALETLFGWFNANGGTNRPTRGAPSLPGLNTQIADGIKSPNARELTLGVVRRIGNRGSIRMDGIYRNFYDFYAQKLDLSTGTVTNSTGRRFDLGIVQNENDLLERTYRGVNFQGSYQPHNRLTLGATYGVGKLRGNIEGETGASGPTTSGIRTRPEYFDIRWNAPVGYLNADVRHKARLWATYDVPLPSVLGRVSLGLVQQYRSGTPYGASAGVASAPFVTNPGYQSTPATVTYFFTARDAFKTDALSRTDLSLNLARRIGLRGTEIFFRGTVFNVADRNKLTNFFDPGCGTGGCISTTIQTNATVTTIARFNPFTETPIEGTHWRKAPTFGQPLSRFAYQTPRTYGFSVGLRF